MSGDARDPQGQEARELKARRLFIGVAIPQPLREAIARALPPERPRGLRWVRPEKLHFTLKFLGETPEERLAAISEAMSRVASSQPASPVRIRSAGVFPSERRARVLWLDTEDDAGLLARLAAHLEEALEELGFPRERRAFVPHLTLARVEARMPPGLLDSLRGREFGTFLPEELVLFESLLSAAGAYVPLARAPLRAPGTGCRRAAGDGLSLAVYRVIPNPTSQGVQPPWKPSMPLSFSGTITRSCAGCSARPKLPGRAPRR
jgi:2'-5' RNA ligase